MPPVIPPWSEHLVQMIKGHERRLSMLEQQQNTTITNYKGQAVMNIGQIPGTSPAQWGYQMVNPNTNQQSAMWGIQGDGSTSLRFYAPDGQTVLIQVDDTGLVGYDSAGAKQIQLNDSGLGVYDSGGNLLADIDGDGFHLYNPSTGAEIGRFGIQSDGTVGLRIFDASGASRVDLGQLSNGDYALQVTDAGGQVNEILPVYSVYAATGGAVTSTSWTSLGAGIEVSAEIGASGKAFVTASVNIGLSNTNLTGNAGVVIDGNTGAIYCPMWNSISSTSGAPDTAVSASLGQLVTGLTAGSHTFAMYGNTSVSGEGVNFNEMAIHVQPL